MSQTIVLKSNTLTAYASHLPLLDISLRPQFFEYTERYYQKALLQQFQTELILINLYLDILRAFELFFLETL